MKHRIWSFTKTTVFVSVLILLALPIQAEAFRCGNRMVNIGDTKAEVLATCGRPIHSEVVEVKSESKWTGRGKWTSNDTWRIKGKSTGSEVPIEVWTYNLGENRLMKILTFEGNILKKIEDGDYGTGPSR